MLRRDDRWGSGEVISFELLWRLEPAPDAFSIGSPPPDILGELFRLRVVAPQRRARGEQLIEGLRLGDALSA